jgi:hypothetical protein
MKKLTSILVLFGALSVGNRAATPSALALPESSPQTQARFGARMNDRQVRAILTRIRTNADTLVRIVDGTPVAGRPWGNRARQPDDVAYLVEDLLVASAHLDDHIVRQQATRADVDDILRRGVLVERALTQTPRAGGAQTSWNNIRRDLDNLANAYGLSWNWQNPQYSDAPATGVYRQLAGTYALDTTRSDNPQRAIDAALRTVPPANRARASRQLTARLNPPDVFAIDRSEGRIIVGSTRGPQFTFDADGQPRTEQMGNQTVTTRAALYGDQLDVTTTGLVNNEFGLTFEPLNGGDSLRVTRRIYTDALRQPVTLQTIYRRTSTTPDWGVYNRANANPPARPAAWKAPALVPEGTSLVARLDQSVNLRAVRQDDRVTLTVRNAPRPELEGATLEGTVIATPSGLNNPARVAVEFDQIRLRNGRFGPFDGVVERVTDPNGRAITFDGEQAIVEHSQTGDALKRGAIGAAIGGLIGALAGGGKGAAIGAAIGGGGGAATVLLDAPKGQSELAPGTEFTIRARSR